MIAMDKKKKSLNHQKQDPDHIKQDKDLSHLPKWKQKLAKAHKKHSVRKPDGGKSLE